MEEKEMKCSCGISASALFKDFDRARAELKKDKPDMWTMLDLLRGELSTGSVGGIAKVERDCGIDLSDSKKLLDNAHNAAMDQKWHEVENEVRNADFGAWNKLLKCSERD